MTTAPQNNIPQLSRLNESGKSYNLIQGDILEWADAYQGEPFHALFCDPPYHLTSIHKRFSKPGSSPAKFGKDGAFVRASRGFMQSDWDGGDLVFRPETWEALGRHLYPGAFGMAFAAARNFHRMACAIEDAGFIIHPAIFGWVYLSGWPKATRIDTQIDKTAGNVRPDKLQGGHIGMGKAAGDPDNGNELENCIPHVIGKGNFSNGTPIDPLAQTWEGHRYGLQALKPALEPIIVFQKPYEGRPVDNIALTGAGTLNIDAGRIQTADDLGDGGYMTPVSEGWDRPWKHNEDLQEEKERLLAKNVAHAEDLGRWPANFYLQHTPDCNGSCPPHCPVRSLDEQSGNRPSGSSKTGNEPSEPAKNTYSKRNPVPFTGHGDDGGASRIFFQSHWSYEILERLEQADPVYYAPKVSTEERDAGLDDLPTRIRHRVNSGGLENEPRFAPTPNKNTHPCLKPISLTRYLAGLLLPPLPYAPRRLLIPFAGSGSEMIGGILAGWEEVAGIEKYPAPDKPVSQENPDYIGIAEARLEWWSEWLKYGRPEVEAILAAEEVNLQQLRMF